LSDKLAIFSISADELNEGASEQIGVESAGGSNTLSFFESEVSLDTFSL
jgi:hypothetical protein